MDNSRHRPSTDVKAVLVTTLGIEDRAARSTPRHRCSASMPELDSLAVVELAAALEERSASRSTTTNSPARSSRRSGSLATFVAGR